MSAATATYTLEEGESIRCTRCRKFCSPGDKVEVTADPDGFVDIDCLPCAEAMEAEKL